MPRPRDNYTNETCLVVLVEIINQGQIRFGLEHQGGNELLPCSSCCSVGMLTGEGKDVVEVGMG